MKILYDYQAFTMQNFGGVSKCFCELIANLPEDIQAEIAIKQSNNIHLRESQLVPTCSKVNIDWDTFSQKYHLKKGHIIYYTLCRLGVLNGMEYVNQRYSINKIISDNFDVFHPTFFNPYFLRYIGKKPWVITIHDLMPEKFPQYFRRDSNDIVFKQKHLSSASAIIAVSNTTKNDLVQMLGVPAEKVTVIYHGGPQIEEIVEKPIAECPYFLYVGSRTAYKNFKQTVKDFAKFHQHHRETKLICTGSDFNENEKALINQLTLHNCVCHYKVDDKQLKNLYGHALAFVYPSLYEGFGMPILEAYAYGCPVLLNDIPVFREVAGNAAIYFSSHEGKSNLPLYLEEVYSMGYEERHNLIERGYTQLSRYSWERSAWQLAELYKSLMIK